MFNASQEIDDSLYNVRIFRQLLHDLSYDISNVLSIDGEDINTLLPLYAIWVK